MEERDENYSINKEIDNSYHRMDIFHKMFFNRPYKENAKKNIKEHKSHLRKVKLRMKLYRRCLWGLISKDQLKKKLSSKKFTEEYEPPEDKKNLSSLLGEDYNKVFKE